MHKLLQIIKKLIKKKHWRKQKQNTVLFSKGGNTLSDLLGDHSHEGFP